MGSRTTLSFVVQHREDAALGIEPYVDGVSLIELVTNFERTQLFEPVGGYGDLIPQNFNYGPLDKYFLGIYEGDSIWGQLGGVYLLGCECGEVGCWPLLCQVKIEGDVVIWNNFQQPHRSERDYSGFGPFVFDLEQYQGAVAYLLSL